MTGLLLFEVFLRYYLTIANKAQNVNDYGHREDAINYKR